MTFYCICRANYLIECEPGWNRPDKVRSADNKKPGPETGFEGTREIPRRTALVLSSLKQLGRAAEGQAHAATGPVATALFRRNVDDGAMLGAVRNARLNPVVAREDVVAGIAFCPFAAARTRKRQVSHVDFLYSSNQATKALEHPREERIRTAFVINRILSALGTSCVVQPKGCPAASAGIT